MSAPDPYRKALARQLYSGNEEHAAHSKPTETWLYDAKKVRPNKLFCVVGSGHLNTVAQQYEKACVTTHKKSEAKAFAAYWEETLGMTDIKMYECKLEWTEVEA